MVAKWKASLLALAFGHFFGCFWPVLWIFCLVVLLSYDVPGPVHYPCSMCYRPVRVNQRALQCDECACWCHCACCGVDICAYTKFQNTKVFSWTCSGCLSNTLPFHDCFVLSSTSSTKSDVAGHCEFVEFPLLSPAGLRVTCFQLS